MLKTPPLQTATATIDTLCGRLQSATLLEDRRAAILGLRSFAKQYPASVASGSLRELITTLRRDGVAEKAEEAGAGDVDTIRLVLETLLMLFNPDAESPEAGDEMTFFMADEFSMRQDNISLLLSLLDPTSPYADYYSRLYSVQILSAVCAARPDRLQECILGAPLGVSRLVGILDDARDSVRSAGLLLLVDLTSGANEELRKIVAFEDVFGRIFSLIQVEGGLAEAGITAQDCLSLLANLIKNSASNQTMFRESGCVTQLAKLLQQALPEDAEAAFVAQAREKSAFGLLQLLRLFLAPGEPSTGQNQVAFFRAGIAQTLIDLAFSPELPIPIRTAALQCISDLIALNHPLQEAFAALTVVTPSDTISTPSATPQTNGSRSVANSNKSSARPSAEQTRAYIIEALLNLTLDQSDVGIAYRRAGCNLIQAYLTGHDRIRAHFLQRAISGHAQQEDAANVLTTLSEGTDPTGLAFASWIVQDLIVDAPEAKGALLAVKEGDESEGEEVLSFLQTLASQLEPALDSKSATDPMAAEAYSSLLSIFLWDFSEGVDDLLAEGSGLVQALVVSINNAASNPELAGLSAVLLGTIYEFSTKDSPIPRRKLAPLLTQKLGRAKYLSALADLRRQPAVRDADLLAEEGGEATLCQTFVDLFQIEYSRLRKAIDKDPGVEVLPASATAAGVDRDVLDDLRQQLQTSKEALAQAQSSSSEAAQKAEQDRLTTAKEMQTATAEVERLRRINQAMQHNHEAELNKLDREREQQKQTIRTEHQRALDTARSIAERQLSAAVKETERASATKVEEAGKKFVEMQNAHRAEQGGHNSTRQQLEKLTSEHKSATAQVESLSAQLKDVTQRHGKLEKEHEQARIEAASANEELEQARKQAEQTQGMVDMFKGKVKELQEEGKGKEDELAAERSGFADLEKELETSKAELENAKKEAEAAKKDLETAKKESGPAKKELEKAKKDLETAKKESESVKQDLETSKTDLSTTKKDLDKAKADLKTSKSELDTAKKDLKTAQDAANKAKADAPSSTGNNKKGGGKKGGDDGAATAAAKKEAESSKKELESSQKEAESAKKDAEAYKAETDGLRSELDALGKELDTLRKSVDSAQEEAKSSKEELESMLLVMGDIEAKRDEYRARIKTMGGEVSEDESEDESDEDEDEEDVDDSALD